MLRAEADWEGRSGTAGEITSALAGWNRLRFEITEEASSGCDGMRFSYTPDLGIFSAVMMANGDIVVPESRLRAAMTVASAGSSPVVRLASGGAMSGPADRARTPEEEPFPPRGGPPGDRLPPLPLPPP